MIKTKTKESRVAPAFLPRARLSSCRANHILPRIIKYSMQEHWGNQYFPILVLNGWSLLGSTLILTCSPHPECLCTSQTFSRPLISSSSTLKPNSFPSTSDHSPRPAHTHHELWWRRCFKGLFFTLSERLGDFYFVSQQQP